MTAEMTAGGDGEAIGGLDWRDMAEAGSDLSKFGLVTSHGGNLSVRRPYGGALITRTGAMLGRLRREDFVLVGAGGQPDDASAPAPSSDTAVHMAIYAAHREAGAVVHAHPIYATALSFNWDVLEPRNLEGRLYLERIPILDVGWEESPRPVAEALRETPVVLVRGHGSYARGADIWDALKVTSALEESAAILYLLQRQ